MMDVGDSYIFLCFRLKKKTKKKKKGRKMAVASLHIKRSYLFKYLMFITHLSHVLFIFFLWIDVTDVYVTVLSRCLNERM